MNSLEPLLQPVSATSVCGEDLSFSIEFDAIAALRREDDPTLDQGEWVTPLKIADWQAVQAQCEQLLTERSKDLRLAMWWAEANAKNRGYEGLKDGIELCSAISERFWDNLHPLPEGVDQEERTGNINWFLQRLVALSVSCPLTRGRSGAYSLQDWAVAKSPTPAPGALTLEQFTKALKDTPREHLQLVLQSMESGLETLARWQASVDAKLGDQGPNFVPPREAFERALHDVRRLGKEVGLWQLDAAAAPLLDGSNAELGSSSASSSSSPQDVGAPRVSGPIQTAEQALAQLREVAAFYRRTQPHSPVAYLVDKAAQWGEMPLHDWLRAVVKDTGTLGNLEELLGIKAEPER